MFGRKSLHEERSFIELQQRIANLEMEMQKMQTHITSLRGLVNRRLFKELPGETEDIKSVDGLDSLRK